MIRVADVWHRGPLGAMRTRSGYWHIFLMADWWKPWTWKWAFYDKDRP